ncbi:three-helix bundle dimerization domain-containing protein [Marmoricola sp. RAF53]|uniref:three-helix bundle dimerization domain-containing protein n=1 Tax=Marmoricola sp. RAF53 TaxID=3233059 RepID=UPI003F98FC1F
MATSEETRVLTQVSDRLSTRFPDVPAQRVTEVVATKYHDFDGARIRDFVEILVERDAADLLSRGSA